MRSAPICILVARRAYRHAPGAETGEAGISHNTWIHRGVRVAVRPLARTPVTPNHITWLRLGTGVAAAAMVAVGAQPWVWIGCAVFVVSVLLDRADGELARLTGKYSDFGHRLDLVSDTLVNALILIGAGIAARDSVLGAWAIPLGLIAGVAVAAVLTIVMRMEERKGARAAELGSRAGFDPDDAILLVPVLILAGWTVPLVIAAAVGATATALFFALRFRRELWPGGQSG